MARKKVPGPEAGLSRPASPDPASTVGSRNPLTVDEDLAPYAGHPDRTAEMGVDNMAFLVERLHADCAPGQFIRELTINGLQAIQEMVQTGLSTGGRIVWTIYLPLFDASRKAKLCCIDTGTGMTGPEMVLYINKLAKSSRIQSATANYGVGAKIAAAPLNSIGMVYMSWKNGKGAMVHLWKNPSSGVYGLKMLQGPDGHWDYWAPIADNDAKPAPIGEHGTAVVLLGRTENEDTTLAPPGVPTPSRWILRHLNGRLFDIPKGIEIAIHEGWDQPVENTKRNTHRVVEGYRDWLAKSSDCKGTIRLKDAAAHWWILSERADRNSGHIPTPGVVAILWQGELYDVAHASSGGPSKLQQFGVIFGTDRVVVVLEPDARQADLTTNTARTTLLLGGQSMPWAEWAAQFRGQLPQELSELMAEYGRKAGATDHRQAIRERLKDMSHLFKLPRYRAVRAAVLLADKDSRVTADEGPVVGDDGDESEEREASQGQPRRQRLRTQARAADYFASLVKPDQPPGEPVDEVRVQELPKVYWVSSRDGNRERNELEDRAANYLPDTHVLKINADFRVFVDMEARCLGPFAHIPGAQQIVQHTVHEWFEQQLIEAVLTAKALEGSPQWGTPDIAELLGEKALTAVVLPRYHVERIINRTLGSRITSLENAKNASERASAANQDVGDQVFHSL